LYSEYQFAAAFAVSTILVATALITLVVKRLLELKFELKGKSPHL
ncbi:sulfate ABC transporter permease subunit CysW, partial [bacterium]|nr:sulfate ABC transporter permease subunit CysW [bacterium]